MFSHLEKEMNKIISAKNPSFIFDYDGTLIPLYKTVEEGVLPSPVKDILTELLGVFENAEILLVTGRPKNFLEKEFFGMPVKAFCEHTSNYLDFSSGKTVTFIENQVKQLPQYQVLKSFFEEISEVYVGFYIEEKTYSIGLHYNEQYNSRDSLLLGQILSKIESLIGKSSLKVAHAKEVIEIRIPGCSKSNFLPRYQKVSTCLPDVFVAFGDDTGDVEMFRTLRNSDIKFKIGNPAEGCSNISNSDEVKLLLKQLIKMKGACA